MLHMNGHCFIRYEINKQGMISYSSDSFILLKTPSQLSKFILLLEFQLKLKVNIIRMHNMNTLFTFLTDFNRFKGMLDELWFRFYSVAFVFLG